MNDGNGEEERRPHEIVEGVVPVVEEDVAIFGLVHNESIMEGVAQAEKGHRRMRLAESEEAMVANQGHDIGNQHLSGGRHRDVPVVTRPWKVNRPWAHLEEQSMANGLVVGVDQEDKLLEAAPNQQPSRRMPSPSPRESLESIGLGYGISHSSGRSQGDASVATSPWECDGQ